MGACLQVAIEGVESLRAGRPRSLRCTQGSRLSSPTELRRGSGDRRGGVVTVQPQPSYPLIQSESLCIFMAPKEMLGGVAAFVKPWGAKEVATDGKSYRLPSLHRRSPSLQSNRSPTTSSG